MHLSRRTILSLAAAGAAGSIMSPIALATTAPRPALQPHVLGDEKAPKRLVVWGSYTCPFTAALMGQLQFVIAEMKGKASVEWRHFPTHAPDPALHVAGLSFEGMHFWGFTFRILQAVYAAGGSFADLTPDKITEFAKAEGGSAKTLEAAYADKAKWATVKQDLMAGKLLGITRTPGLFYNGYFLTPNGIPMDMKAFDKSLREMLAKG